MHKIFKRLIPEKLIILRSLSQGYFYDLRRYLKHSNSYKKLKTEKHYHALITYTYHVIEKGLTMPEPRNGFGQAKINELINLCNRYMYLGFDKTAILLLHSIQVLNEYLDFHEKQDYKLPGELIEKIKDLASKVNENKISQQLVFSKEGFLKSKNAPFNEFCLSRHSVRNYSDKSIPMELLNECTFIAQKSPSACNRQPNHVYIIKDKKIQNDILSLQSGNRGFGHLADTLVIFTGDISAFRFQDERNEVYFNSGMFAMTFIYALHSKGIGSCCLNWSVTPKKDQKLRKIIPVPENETITLILSCGYLLDQFKVAASPRMHTAEIIHFIA